MSSDFEERLNGAQDFDHALDILAEITDGLGYSQVLYGYVPMPARLPDGEWVPLKLNVRNFPKGWYSGWRQFETEDPYYHACFSGTLPFEWAEVQANDGLNRREKEAWQYLADFGLDRGITTPVHLPGGRFAAVSAIVDRSTANWRDIRERTASVLFSLTHTFHKVVHEKGFSDQIDYVMPIQLSPREKECLKWAASGKATSETAIIMERSEETIRLHIKNAMLKLGVHKRAHATAKAVRLGLIEPYDH
jgi:LuxR family transcriptional regulator